jgi:hypothetical protein
MPPEGADQQRDQVEEGLADQDNPDTDAVPKGKADAEEDARQGGIDPEATPGEL